MMLRTFTVAPQPDSLASTTGTEVKYAILANYPEFAKLPRNQVTVCSGWSRSEVLEQFRRIRSAEAVRRLAQELVGNNIVTVQLSAHELDRWYPR